MSETKTAGGDPAETSDITESGHSPTLDKVVLVVGVAIALIHIYFNIFGVLSGLWRNAIHFAGFAFLCALVYPMLSRWSGGRLPLPVRIFDVAFGLLVAGSAFYMVAAEDAVYARGVRLSTLDWIAGSIVIIGALEFTRRTTGLIVPILIVLSITYVGWWGAYVDGVFRFAGLSWETILFRSIYGDDGIFGTIARISSSFVFMFILFGAFLLRSGGGEFVINLARAIAGRLTGGPGLVAVFASGLTGTISGSAVANTASTGVITIPLMKRAGFPPKFAAAVEASASTGGQLMPPIMGAGAFVMASYTQIPYTTIVAVSALPAILFFASIIFYVRIEAKRSNVQVMDEETVSVGELMRNGGLPFLIPIAALIALLMSGFTPTYAAGLSILAVIASSWLTKNPMGPMAIIEAMGLGARNMIMTGVLLCSIGLVVNVIAMSGVGNTFSLMITQWAGDSLFIAIVLVALASLVLGMGLPVTAAYIVLGTLSAPALYNLIADGYLQQALMSGAITEEAKAMLMLVAPDQAATFGQPMTAEAARALMANIPAELGETIRTSLINKEQLMFALLSAHLIIFWLSQDSNVTPPVCLTAFTAAAIAKTPPMATGFVSWKIAKALYIIPLLFAYSPFIGGSTLEVLQIFFFSLIGLYCVSALFQGHLENTLNWPMRIAIGAAGLFLLWPLNIWFNLTALAAFAAIFVINIRQQASDTPATA